MVNNHISSTAWGNLTEIKERSKDYPKQLLLKGNEQTVVHNFLIIIADHTSLRAKEAKQF